MAITHGVVSVGATATSAGGVNVFIGGTGVTSASYGYLLVGGSAFAIDLQAGEGLYGVVASGTQSVSVIRQGV